MSSLSTFDLYAAQWAIRIAVTVISIIGMFVLINRYRDIGDQKTKEYRGSIRMGILAIILLALSIIADIFLAGYIFELITYVLPVILYGTVLLAISSNIRLYRKAKEITKLRVESQNKESNKIPYIIGAGVLVFISIIFFFPKSSGSGGTCPGCVNTECKCMGIEKNYVYIGPWHSTCYGVPYSCQKSTPIPIATPTPEPVTEYPLEDGQHLEPLINYSFDTSTFDGEVELVNTPELRIGQECISGNCLAFNGSSQRMLFRTPRLEKYSVSGWIKQLSVQSGESQIFNAPMDSVGLTIQSNGNFIFFDKETLESKKKSEVGIFYHLVIVNDGEFKYLYIDGKLDAKAPIGGSPMREGFSALASMSAYQQRYFNGVVDEFRIYDRPLGAKEIAELYANSK